MKYAKFPVNFVGVSQRFKGSAHWGTDFGWNSAHGGPNVAVYAVDDGEVVSAVSNDPNVGNMIVTMHKNLISGKWVLTRSHHLSKFSVKKGDTLKQGQQIGNMGDTGKTTGPHLHFEFWICPVNFVYSASDKSKYAVNPMLNLYLYPDQTGGVNTKNIMKLPGEDDYKELYEQELAKAQAAGKLLTEVLEILK